MYRVASHIMNVRIGVAVALAGAVNSAGAQAAKVPGAPIRTEISLAAPAVPAPVVWSGPSLSAADAARLNAIVALADSMSVQRRVGDAARLYWSVVSEQRAAAEYPLDALHQLALLYYRADDEHSAAEVLMELAESAAEFGDAPVRLRSLFDAALLYKRLGRNDRVAECVRRIWPLLKSPAISQSLRAEFAARMLQR